MEKTHNNQSRESVTTADLRAMKTEIIDAVKDTMKEMMEELTATHEDVRVCRACGHAWGCKSPVQVCVEPKDTGSARAFS
jgi:rubrerythrin